MKAENRAGEEGVSDVAPEMPRHAEAPAAEEALEAGAARGVVTPVGAQRALQERVEHVCIEALAEAAWRRHDPVPLCRRQEEEDERRLVLEPGRVDYVWELAREDNSLPGSAEKR